MLHYNCRLPVELPMVLIQLPRLVLLPPVMLLTVALLVFLLLQRLQPLLVTVISTGITIAITATGHCYYQVKTGTLASKQEWRCRKRPKLSLLGHHWHACPISCFLCSSPAPGLGEAIYEVPRHVGPFSVGLCMWFYIYEVYSLSMQGQKWPITALCGTGHASAIVSQECPWLSSSDGLPAPQPVDRETTLPLFLDMQMHHHRGFFSLDTTPVVPIWGLGSGWLWDLSGSCCRRTTVACWEENEHLRREIWPLETQVPIEKKESGKQPICNEESCPWAPPFPEPSLNLETFHSGLLNGWPVHTKLP